MSYLDPPRFHFVGLFRATPSTVNNQTENFAPEVTLSADPNASPLNRNSISWNPTGLAFFELQSVLVTGACLELGTLMKDPGQDPILGAAIESVAGGATHNQGRIVDLDPDFQMRTMIVGLKLQLTVDDVTVTGVVDPMTIIDIWGRMGGGSPTSIAAAGCMYQSVIRQLDWGPNIEGSRSQVLRRLHQASPETLSIKLNVDAFNGSSQLPNFATGRLVGTIGPYGMLAPGVPEPLHLLAQRRMWALASGVSSATPLFSAPFQVRGGFLTVDLGNSIPTMTGSPAPTPFQNLGPVALLLPGAGGAPTPCPLFDDFTEPYATGAGIFDVPLSPEQAAGLAAAPLALQFGGPEAPPSMPALLDRQQVKLAKEGESVPAPIGRILLDSPTIGLAENPNGQFASLDFNSLRLAQDASPWTAEASGAEITSEARVPLFATVFGAPAKNVVLGVRTALNNYQFNNDQGLTDWINNDPAGTAGQPAITPAPAGWQPADPQSPPATPYSTLPQQIAAIETNEYGIGTLAITAGRLTAEMVAGANGQPNRRGDLPSQLYFYTHDWALDFLQPLVILLFVDTPGPAQPTWSRDIAPIFQKYAQLYPGMRNILDLGDFATVKQFKEKFRLVMNLPMTDPGFMPVTRDFAPAQLAMLNAWFDNPLE